MALSATILATLILVHLPSASLAVPVQDDPVMEVRVDETNQVIIITAGPFHLPKKDGAHEGGHSHDPSAAYTPIMRLNWPVEGWLRGFSLRLREADGTEIPKKVIHHFVALNFERRQLVYPVIERLFAVGQETSEVLLPGFVGVPLRKGGHLGLYSMWDNTTGRDLEAHLEIRINYLSANQKPQFEILPMFVDVNMRLGHTGGWNIVPGENIKSFEFEVPTAGRIVMAGGHLHDYGHWIRLEDAATGETLLQLNSELDDEGRILEMERRIFLGDQAIRLLPGRKYRLVGKYDNPLDKTITEGAMAQLHAVFLPDNGADWPMLDQTTSIYREDMATLPQGELRVREAAAPPEIGRPAN